MSDFRLKVFRSVAKNLSFTKASQELFVSQPAITKHIQELEAAYQTRLFDRQGSRISLTESGNLLLYNPQIQISAESETKRSIFREKDKTKRSKKESAQHSKSRNKSFVMTSVSAL